MSRAIRKIAYLCALAALLLALSGCVPLTSPGSGTSISPHGAHELAPDALSQGVVRQSLTIIPKRADMSGCGVTYPYVCNSNMEILNISIHSAYASFAQYCETPGGEIGYSVEFNRYGLLSVLMECTFEGRVIFTDTANFDTDTGKRVYLSDCFGSTDTDYRVRLRDILARSVEQNEYTLLGQEPSMDDSTLFLFTYGGIYLVFREYEIFTSDAGEPRIMVKISSVMDHLAPDGLLNRVK